MMGNVLQIVLYGSLFIHLLLMVSGHALASAAHRVGIPMKRPVRNDLE